MDLIERYIYAVTRSLPKSQRTDVEKELRSDIHDMVDAENGSETERVRKTLETLGRPEALALSYTGAKQYLIGPEWFSVYIETLKKIGAIAAIALLCIFTATTVFTDAPFIEKIIDILISTIGGAMQIAFWITAIFVFLEHSKSREFEKDKKEILAWSVDSLPDLPPERHTNVSDIIANIVFYAALIVLALLTRQTLGFNSDGTHISFFNPDLWTFWMWAIIAAFAGLIGKELYTLKTGRETATSIWAKIAFDGAITAMLVGLYLRDALINPIFAQKTQELWGGEVTLDSIVQITLVIWVISFIYDAVRSVVKLRSTQPQT